jgi:type VI secretion system protein ImpK
VASDDKTIFGAGSGLGGDGDSTIVIPNPGGRLRPEGGSGPGLAPPPPPGAAPAGAAQRLPSTFHAQVKGQTNPILAASNTLIAVLSALSNSMSHPNVAQLQQELATEIGNFDNRLKQAGVSNEEALTARYVLCAAIDEAVMDTPWGLDSGWGNRGLLRAYHKETSGGERFFTLLDQLLSRPGDYRDLLELFYVLLCMGFRGKYQLEGAGDSRLETLRERLYSQLYGDRSYERALSDSALIGQTAHQKLRHRMPLWIVLSVALALTLLVYSGLRTWMYSGTVDIVKSFDQLYPTTDLN